MNQLFKWPKERKSNWMKSKRRDLKMKTFLAQNNFLFQ